MFKGRLGVCPRGLHNFKLDIIQPNSICRRGCSAKNVCPMGGLKQKCLSHGGLKAKVSVSGAVAVVVSVQGVEQSISLC